ncbi:MAG: acylglycerol kinase family protein, partial [Lachnospiraceae bacterium]|nr:acylglycerol kinase family protein [Lachnospiraceae bacterium]
MIYLCCYYFITKDEVDAMYHIIINPTSKSGKGLAIWKTLEPVLLEKNVSYRTYISTHTGHVSELTSEITSSSSDAEYPLNLILLGGDGTVNEALQGIKDFSKVNIGYIPTGSSNDLARALKLRRDPVELLLQILDGTKSRMIDLGILTYEDDNKIVSRLHKRPESKSRYFIVSSGIGFDAAVCE